jgi:hypothetical protein
MIVTEKISNDHDRMIGAHLTIFNRDHIWGGYKNDTPVLVAVSSVSVRKFLPGGVLNFEFEQICNLNCFRYKK